MQIYLTLDHAANIGVTDVAASPATGSNTAYTSFANASNQITRFLAAGTTIQLYISIPAQEGTFTPYYGLPGNAEQAAYISIEKISS
jgi:hypothetical protein